MRLINSRHCNSLPAAALLVMITTATSFLLASSPKRVITSFLLSSSPVARLRTSSSLLFVVKPNTNRSHRFTHSCRYHPRHCHSSSLLNSHTGPSINSKAFLSNHSIRSSRSTSTRTSLASSTKDTSTMNDIDLSSFQVSISDAFDGGNGKFLKTQVTSNELAVLVNIKKDPFTQLEQCHHFQYFSFRSTIQQQQSTEKSATNVTVKYVVANAGKASYPSAWDGSTIFTSTTPSDPFSWTRKLDTTYDTTTGQLSWTHEHNLNPNSDVVYFSYFPPYSYERHLDFISKCALHPRTQVTSLGQSLDGREIECIKIGSGQKQCWIIHRQHPGETMAEFYAEGLVSRLLGLDHGYSVDGLVKDVLNMYTFHIVPCMCPDGSYRGHLRTNASGQNLNREWCSSGTKEDGTYYEAPSLERSPEVYYVLKKMDETGVDAFLDVHGDEELPFNFLAGGEGCPNWSPRLEMLQGAFLQQYARSNSDMQVPIAYEPEEPGQGRLNVCSNQIGTRYDCLSVTLEMPFKDCLSNPDPDRGWNPARSKMLGASVLEPLLYVGKYLRMEGEFWKDVAKDEGVFGEEDKYVRPTANYKSVKN